MKKKRRRAKKRGPSIAEIRKNNDVATTPPAEFPGQFDTRPRVLRAVRDGADVVSTATQPVGGCGSVGWMRFANAANAISDMAALPGQTASAPVNAAQSKKPHRPVAGRRMPAARTGDDQPITPSGGTIVRKTASGTSQDPQRRRRSCRLRGFRARLPGLGIVPTPACRRRARCGLMSRFWTTLPITSKN
jgi:hypothetical protein